MRPAENGHGVRVTVGELWGLEGGGAQAGLLVGLHGHAVDLVSHAHEVRGDEHALLDHRHELGQHAMEEVVEHLVEHRAIFVLAFFVLEEQKVAALEPRVKRALIDGLRDEGARLTNLHSRNKNGRTWHEKLRRSEGGRGRERRVKEEGKRERKE